MLLAALLVLSPREATGRRAHAAPRAIMLLLLALPTSVVALRIPAHPCARPRDATAHATARTWPAAAGAGPSTPMTPCRHTIKVTVEHTCALH